MLNEPKKADQHGHWRAVEQLLVEAQPRLERALIAQRGVDGAKDAAAEAIAWGLANTTRLGEMTNPIGYLYRVAVTRSVPRRQPLLPPVDATRLPEVEPGLVPALLALPERQRVSVWLVHACEWSYHEVADALGIGTSTVGTHVGRGLDSLRDALGHNPHHGESR